MFMYQKDGQLLLNFQEGQIPLQDVANNDVRIGKTSEDAFVYVGEKNLGGDTVSKIEIAHAPTKVDYVAGETFDPTGVRIKVTYTSGATETIYKTNPGLTYSPDVLSQSDTAVTFTFGGQSVNQEITVTAAEQADNGEQ